MYELWIAFSEGGEQWYIRKYNETINTFDSYLDLSPEEIKEIEQKAVRSTVEIDDDFGGITICYYL